MKRGSIDVSFLIVYLITTALALATSCFCVLTLKQITNQQKIGSIGLSAFVAVSEMQDELEEKEVRTGLTDQEKESLKTLQETNAKRFRDALETQGLTPFEIDMLVEQKAKARQIKLDLIREELRIEKELRIAKELAEARKKNAENADVPKSDREILFGLLEEIDSLNVEERKTRFSILILQALEDLKEIEPLNEQEQKLWHDYSSLDWKELLKEMEDKQDYQNKQLAERQARRFAELSEQERRGRIYSLRTVIKKHLDSIKALTEDCQKQADSRQELKALLQDPDGRNGSSSNEEKTLYDNILRIEELEKKSDLSMAEKEELDKLSEFGWSYALDKIKRAEQERIDREKERERQEELLKQQAEEQARREALEKEREAAEQAKKEAERLKREQEEEEARQKRLEEKARKDASREEYEREEQERIKKQRAKMNYEE